MRQDYQLLVEIHPKLVPTAGIPNLPTVGLIGHYRILFLQYQWLPIAKGNPAQEIIAPSRNQDSTAAALNMAQQQQPNTPDCVPRPKHEPPLPSGAGRDTRSVRYSDRLSLAKQKDTGNSQLEPGHLHVSAQNTTTGIRSKVTPRTMLTTLLNPAPSTARSSRTQGQRRMLPLRPAEGSPSAPRLSPLPHRPEHRGCSANGALKHRLGLRGLPGGRVPGSRREPPFPVSHPLCFPGCRRRKDGS